MTPSPASRFGGFAAGHFVVTTICALLPLALLCLSVDTTTPLTIVWTMALSPSWYGCIFLAGLLPPLLFFLGSLLPHRVTLEEIAADCLNQRRTAELYKGVEVEGVFPGEHPIVQFSTGGFGLVPSTGYCGFYYSESGRPAGSTSTGSPTKRGFSG